jgi:hypothetical protein
MKHKFLIAIIGTLSTLPLAAIAADCSANLSWSAPITNTDGSALAKCATQTSTPTPACLRGYIVYSATTAAGIASGTKIQINDRNALTYTHTVTNCASHTRYYAVSAFDSAGTESVLSAVGNKVFVIPTIPNAPGNFTVQPDVAGATAGTAYRMRDSVDSYEFVALGTVPIGTPCNAAKATVDGYALIPRASVKMASSLDTMPLKVYAKCSAG